MESKMNCPACGADIEIPENEDRVRCEFCGTELQASRDEGKTKLKLLSQPEPQTSEMIEANQRVGEDLDDSPEAGSGSLSYPAVSREVPVAVESIPETLPYQAGSHHVGTGGSSTTARWIAIGVAIFVFFCVLCACVTGAILIASGMIAA